MATYTDLITEATRKLAGSSDSARLDAEVLLRHVSGLDRTGLLIALRDPVPREVQDRFSGLVAKRACGVPVAYLTGTREFMGLTFRVNEHVLVPRPETELLVEWALGLVQRLGKPHVRAVDVGSGSGAIAVSLAALAPDPIGMTATEPSPGAREVIALNRDTQLSPERQSSFRMVDDDLLTNTSGPFDLVLANLPYLTPEQIAGNPDLDAEPRMALDGGAEGIDLLERLIEQLPSRLARTFGVGLEIDPSQSDRVVDMLRRRLPGVDVSVIRDYAGFDRHVVATRLAGAG